MQSKRNKKMEANGVTPIPEQKLSTVKRYSTFIQQSKAVQKASNHR